MNCEVGRSQRGIKRVLGGRKSMVLRKSQKGIYPIPEKTAVSKVCSGNCRKAKKERETEKTPGSMHECGKQTEGKADCQLHAPKLRVRTSERRGKHSPGQRDRKRILK